VTWSQLRTFALGCIAVTASALLGPLYNRFHRLSKEK